MDKFIRVILFTIALGMYFLFILKSDNIVIAVTKIMIVALLLLGMEAIRRDREKVFLIHSDITRLKNMKNSEFMEYVAQLYKKLGYYIDPIKKDKDLGCDLIVRKNRDVICIKCISEEAEVNLEPLQAAYGSKNLYRANKSLVITPNGYTDKAKQFARANHMILVDQMELIKLITKAIGNKDSEMSAPNTQEA
ncbi:restriction endonuclease [Zhenhengia yiwuensis]|uniref:Restriction endonuclease n=1 Tax=Zhenhengia yiwuensis TaxID=2763666 RepID=A0A926EGT9_9FIRM|nr:restriction endonuclease [Zhenhengia yiwuensis]MBC8580033.1 restriction endonuclease [Zhenhengia yiwuensis]